MEESSEQPPKFTEDPRANKDWLQAWFGTTHSDLQWSKAQSWNAVQWSILLIGAFFAGSQQYKTIPRAVWVVFTLGIAALSTWWLIDLHSFAKSAREASEKIVASLEERNYYLPRRSKDQHHKKLLVAKIAVVVIAAVVSAIEIALR